MQVTLFRPTIKGKKRNWYVKITDDQGRTRKQSLKTRSKKDALEIAQALERKLLMRNAGCDDRRDILWQKAWELYVGAMARKAKRTIEIEYLCWSQFFTDMNRPTLRSVTPTHVAAWQTHLITVRKNKPRSVNDKLSQLKTVWTWINKLKIYTGDNPCKDITRIPVPKRNVPKFLPWEDIELLLANAQMHGRDIHLLFVLGALAGLRINEILLQRWEYIDWTQKRFNVRATKNLASTAAIPLHATLEAALLPYKEDSGWVVMPGSEWEKSLQVGL